jgi:hypothetical protein
MDERRQALICVYVCLMIIELVIVIAVINISLLSRTLSSAVMPVPTRE